MELMSKAATQGSPVMEAMMANKPHFAERRNKQKRHIHTKPTFMVANKPNICKNPPKPQRRVTKHLTKPMWQKPPTKLQASQRAPAYAAPGHRALPELHAPGPRLRSTSAQSVARKGKKKAPGGMGKMDPLDLIVFFRDLVLAPGTWT